MIYESSIWKAVEGNGGTEENHKYSTPEHLENKAVVIFFSVMQLLFIQAIVFCMFENFSCP
jgi:hypothetical protein